MAVNLQNTNTGETHSRLTVSGEFMYDLTEFGQGWSSSHVFKITYCVGDSRCSAVSDTFSIVGDHKDLRNIINLLDQYIRTLRKKKTPKYFSCVTNHDFIVGNLWDDLSETEKI